MADLSLIRAVCWRRDDGLGAEYAALWRDGPGWQLRGTVVMVIDGRPVSVRYGILCDAGWHTTAVHIAQRATAPEQGLHLTRTDGEWRTNGVRRPELAGCIDVDLEITPATNTLPIRRLDLSPGTRVDVVAAWVRFPSLEIERLDQTYARIGANRYVYSSGDFKAELTVDDLGLVVNYEDAWTRISR